MFHEIKKILTDVKFFDIIFTTMEVAIMPTLEVEEHVDRHIDLIDKFIQLKKFSSNILSKLPDSLLKGTIPDLKQIYRHLQKK